MAFWRGHVRVGVGTVLVGSLAGLGYLAATPDGPHRAILLWAAVASLLSAPLVAALPHDRIVLHRNGALFYYGWNLGFCTLISGLAILDGGAGSPLVYFYPVNTIISSVAFSRRGALLMTACQISAYLATATAGGEMAPSALFAVAIAMVSVACLATAERLRSLLAQQEELAAQLNELVHLDALTGSLNHRSFHEHLDELTADAVAAETPLTLALVDLDEFAHLNDSFGHLTGDGVLRAVAETLRAASGETALVARFGGDEFAVLAPGVAGDARRQLVADLRAAIAEITHPLPVRASVGTAELLRGMTSGEQLFAEADRALTASRRDRRPVLEVR